VQVKEMNEGKTEEMRGEGFKEKRKIGGSSSDQWCRESKGRL